MSWSQVLSDVTSRISAASQTLQNLEAKQYLSHPNNHADSPAYVDPAQSSMSVRVQLDQQNVPFYTNLDLVAGRVILSLATDTTISAINVKLQGETRTRLSGPRFPNDPKNRTKVELEVHKLLYKVQTVFPSLEIDADAVNSQYTLPAGQYSYPFSIKIPINNDCANNTKLFQDLRLGPLSGLEGVGVRHVKQTLPPAMGGLPGEAEIKYFVKATVVRPKFYQENMRSVANLKFQPIEPPQPPKKGEETYARRQHQFQPVVAVPQSRKSSLFSKTQTMPIEGTPPAIKVEARLPSPAILTCHQPIPLRVMVEKTNDSSASLYLSLLQIELISSTNVRAHDLARTEMGSWVLMSQANMNLQLDTPADKSSRVFLIPSRFWENIPLPGSVIPSFNTCNISRSYELEVRLGISHGMADGIRPELIVLPLRIAVEVYSGVPPPDKLLGRINTQKPSSSHLTPPKPTQVPHHHSPVTPDYDQIPPQSGSYMAPPHGGADDFPPPSYEDAMAEDIVPVDGPRRDFSTETSSPSANRDSKYASGLGRHPSERLFSQNAPSPPGVTSQSSANTQTVDPAAASVTDLLTDFEINDTYAPPAHPPPLPLRKETLESPVDQKRDH